MSLLLLLSLKMVALYFAFTFITTFVTILILFSRWIQYVVYIVSYIEFLCNVVTDIVAAAVLSGNRNFEGRVHPLTRANYLASPPLVVAYALAGTVSKYWCLCLCHRQCWEKQLAQKYEHVLKKIQKYESNARKWSRKVFEYASKNLKNFCSQPLNIKKMLGLALLPYIMYISKC